MALLKKYIIRNPMIRERVCAAIAALPSDILWEVSIAVYKKTKSREQERHYHALIADITPKFEFMGRKGWAKEDVKRVLIALFAIARAQEGKPLRQAGRQEIYPLPDGGIVVLGNQSRHFTVEEASDFIESLYAFGAELGVQWGEAEEDDWREAA